MIGSITVNTVYHAYLFIYNTINKCLVLAYLASVPWVDVKKDIRHSLIYLALVPWIDV